MGWLAFLLVLVSMGLLAINVRVAGWIANLFAGAVWLWVAADEQLYSLGAQQAFMFLVGILGLVNALRDRNRRRNRAI